MSNSIGWISFVAFVAFVSGAVESCSSSSTAGVMGTPSSSSVSAAWNPGADASSSNPGAEASSSEDVAPGDEGTRGCLLDFGGENVTCTEPVDCSDGGRLPPCTWAAALAYVCPQIGENHAEVVVETCTGGINAWTLSGVDSVDTFYYSAATGQIVASIGGGAPGGGTCQAPCNFVFPAPQTTTTPGGCTVDESPCTDGGGSSNSDSGSQDGANGGADSAN